MATNQRKQILEWLRQTGPPVLDETLAAEMRARLPAVSEHTFRQALRESGIPMTPLVEGVRQEDLHQLERTLRALEVEYTAAVDLPRKRAVRRLVLTAKSHAELAVRRKPQKQETILWLRTWLEDPPVFPSWVELRKRHLAETGYFG